MASAFISYAHEDEEFMLPLAEHLQGQRLDIRYAQVVLNIGDSLIQKIWREIADGDFVVAIVSPDSVPSTENDDIARAHDEADECAPRCSGGGD